MTRTAAPFRLISRLSTGRISRFVVIAVWLVLIGVGTVYGAKLPSVEHNNQSSFLPSSSPSVRVANLERSFPGGSVTPALVVFASSHRLTAADLAVINSERTTIETQHIPDTLPPTSLEVSRDHKAGIFSIAFRHGTNVTTISQGIHDLQGDLSKVHSQLKSGVTGPAALLTDQLAVFGGINTKLLIATVLVVALILILTYRSPFLWLLPLISVALALEFVMGLMYFLGRAGLTLNGMTIGILTVVVFGAGTDYALLLIARYREELRTTKEPREALEHAIGRVLPALTASAATVVLALICLLAARETDISALGPVCALGIVAVYSAMLTLLPAMLSLVGRKVFYPRIPEIVSSQDQPPRSAVWDWIVRTVRARYRTVWAVGAAALIVCAFGLSSLHTHDVTHDGLVGTVPALAAEGLLSHNFPAGDLDPVVVISSRNSFQATERIVAAQAGVSSVSKPVFSGHYAKITATLSHSPTSPAALATVSSLSSSLSRNPQLGALVGGTTASQLDLSLTAARDLRVVIPLILIVVLIMLAVLLRSIIAPIVLVVSVLGTYFAALGIGAVFFRDVFHFGGTDPSLPLFAFVFLVALGVDYSVFLMARARQETQHHPPREAVLVALKATGGVITSAGVVLAATFSVLSILPLVVLSELGFVVALGVLLDTFLVRSLVVPSLALEIGKRFWWPKEPVGST